MISPRVSLIVSRHPLASRLRIFAHSTNELLPYYSDLQRGKLRGRAVLLMRYTATPIKANALERGGQTLPLDAAQHGSVAERPQFFPFFAQYGIRRVTINCRNLELSSTSRKLISELGLILNFPRHQLFVYRSQSTEESLGLGTHRSLLHRWRIVDSFQAGYPESCTVRTGRYVLSCTDREYRGVADRARALLRWPEPVVARDRRQIH